MSRIDSLAFVSSAISKGGVSEREKMVSSVQWISISPVGRLGLRRSPRSRTTPRRPMQNSERSSPARACAAALVCGSNTTCVMPPRSRRSMNTQPPWSRRDETQPKSTTVEPTSVPRRAPQSWVRFRSLRNSGMRRFLLEAAGLPSTDSRGPSELPPARRGVLGLGPS